MKLHKLKFKLTVVVEGGSKTPQTSLRIIIRTVERLKFGSMWRRPIRITKHLNMRDFFNINE